MSAFVCYTRRELAEELAAKPRAKGLECGRGTTPKRAKSLQETLPSRRQETIVQTEQQAKEPVLLNFFFWGSWAQHSANQGIEMRDKLLPKPVTEAARKLQCRPSDEPRDLLSFVFFGGTLC